MSHQDKENQFAGTLCSFICYCLFLGLHIAGLVMASTMTCDGKQPTWLYIWGIIGCVAFVVNVCGLVADCYSRPDEANYFKVCTNTISLFLILGNLVILILGSVWFYPGGLDVTNCEQVVTRFTWWMITVSWGIFGLASLIVSCCLVPLMCMGAFSMNRDGI